METITREPRLLVKLPAVPAGAATKGFGLAPARLRFNGKPIDVQFERLFRSIPAATGAMAAVAPGEWYVVSAVATGAEGNVWDLCHSLVREGFGVAGLDRASFAEPDLEQSWLSGTPVQHALAAAGGCVRRPA